MINPVNSSGWAVVIVRCECQRSWLGLAECVLRSWEMTLRLALLLAPVLTGAVVGMALGIA